MQGRDYCLEGSEKRKLGEKVKSLAGTTDALGRKEQHGVNEGKTRSQGIAEHSEAAVRGAAHGHVWYLKTWGAWHFGDLVSKKKKRQAALKKNTA